MIEQELVARKFLFDCSFEPDILAAQDDAENMETYTPQEVAQFRENAHETGHQTGYQKGYSDGHQKGCQDTHPVSFQEGYDKAYGEIEEKISQALKNIENKLSALIVQEQIYQDQAYEDIIVLSSHILNKLFPSLLGKFGQEEIVDFITRTISSIHDPVQVDIIVNDEILDSLEIKLGDVLKNKMIRLKASTEIETHDCMIEWGTGGSQRLCSNLMQDVDSHLETFLSSLEKRPEQNKKRKKITLEK